MQHVSTIQTTIRTTWRTPSVFTEGSDRSFLSPRGAKETEEFVLWSRSCLILFVMWSWCDLSSHFHHFPKATEMADIVTNNKAGSTENSSISEKHDETENQGHGQDFWGPPSNHKNPVFEFSLSQLTVQLHTSKWCLKASTLPGRQLLDRNAAFYI